MSGENWVTGQALDPSLTPKTPSKQSLAGILSEKRMKMLAELRDIEQALEALERTPEIESTLQHVMRFLQRSY